MKNRNIIKQDFQLVNAKYKLDTSEIKFILTAISQIDMDDKELTIYEIKVSDLEETLNSEQNSTRLKQFAKKLMSKPLEVPTERGWAVFNWFSKIEYVNGESKFIVNIHSDLKPYLLNLKERFVKYNMQYILPLTSNYSIRIYQLLKEYEKLTRRTFIVTELQELLQVPKSYKLKYNDFKKKVLNVAQKELLAHCDICFDYEEIKTNRKITELLFRIYPNKKIFEPEPSLFGELESEFEEYMGKEIATTSGKKKILSITKFSDSLKIIYEDGEYTVLPDITALKTTLRL